MAIDASKELVASLRELAVRDFKFFVQSAWAQYEPTRPVVWGFHFDAICEHLQAIADGAISDLIIEIAPRHGKSSLCSVLWPSWMIARNPGWRQLHASFGIDLAQRDVMKSRKLLQSHWFRRVFQPEWTFATDNNTKRVFETSETGYRRATSPASSATGFGGNNKSGDDLLPASSKKLTLDLMDSVNTWINEEYMSRDEDAKAATNLFVGQRVGVSDALGFVRECMPNADVLTLDIEYDPTVTVTTSIGWTDPRTEDGELLWEEGFGADEVARAQRKGEAIYNTQYRQRPTSENEQMITPDLIRFYTTHPDTAPIKFRAKDGGYRFHPQQPLPPESSWGIKAQSWDMTFKDGNKSDRVAGQVVTHVDNQIFLIDWVCDTMGFIETVEAVEALWRKHPDTLRIYVELAANGYAAVELLQRKTMGIVEGVKANVGKDVRLQAVLSIMQNLWLPHPKESDSAAALLKELYAFRRGKRKKGHDDQVDALSQLLAKFAQLIAEEDTGDVFFDFI